MNKTLIVASYISITYIKQNNHKRNQETNRFSLHFHMCVNRNCFGKSDNTNHKIFPKTGLIGKFLPRCIVTDSVSAFRWQTPQPSS